MKGSGDQMKGAKPKTGNVIPMVGDAQQPIPDPPGYLSDEGKEVWARLAPDMVRLGRLKPHYHDLFAVYCEAAADIMPFTISFQRRVRIRLTAPSVLILAKFARSRSIVMPRCAMRWMFSINLSAASLDVPDFLFIFIPRKLRWASNPPLFKSSIPPQVADVRQAVQVEKTWLDMCGRETRAGRACTRTGNGVRSRCTWIPPPFRLNYADYGRRR